jgi:hypothetical protein
MVAIQVIVAVTRQRPHRVSFARNQRQPSSFLVISLKCQGDLT